MLIVLIISIIVIVTNYILGAKLFEWPRNKEYYNNVKNINTIRKPEIAPEPQYVLLLTVFTGILIGIFITFTELTYNSGWYSTIFSIIIIFLYYIEISRRITLTDNSLIFSKAFSKTKVIDIDDIRGAYIYSYNKKFMKGHAFTTKLVIVTTKEKTKFTISSLNNQAILNLIKNNFGVTDYKIYIAKK